LIRKEPKESSRKYASTRSVRNQANLFKVIRLPAERTCLPVRQASPFEDLLSFRHSQPAPAPHFRLACAFFFVQSHTEQGAECGSIMRPCRSETLRNVFTFLLSSYFFLLTFFVSPKKVTKKALAIRRQFRQISSSGPRLKSTQMLFLCFVDFIAIAAESQTPK
jgi:hypothetical protein